jgi:C-terminal processing protease CtpA/Prc
MILKRSHLLFQVVLLVVALAAAGPAQEDKLQPGDRELGRTILADVAGTIRKDYYDPKYHGEDFQARYKDTLTRIDKATSFNQMLGLIAWFVDSLNDSHTYFIPPPRAYKLDYGWRVQMVGDRCYVAHVKPGSDAEKQGVKPGEIVESIMGVQPSRGNIFKLLMLLNALRPQPVVRLVLLSPGGAERTLDVQAAIKPTRHEITGYSDWMDEVRNSERSMDLYNRKSVQLGGDILVWKLHDFMMNEKGVDDVISKARNDKVLILDLRDNPGGSADAVVRMIGDLFVHDVKVAVPRGRKKLDMKSIAKGRGDKAFTGKLIVLVDSQSASASEILARVVQLEGRGIVIGDRSAGAVMLAEGHARWHGLERSVFYGVSVTEADMIMKDGKSLERVGVTPDELVLPTPEDLASGRDPVLARAVELGGGKITPEAAGKLFPFEWPPL